MNRGARRGRGRGVARGRGRNLRRLVRRMHDGVDRPDPRIPREPPRLSWGQSYYTRTFRNEFSVSVAGKDGAYNKCLAIKDICVDSSSGASNLFKCFQEVRINYINVWIMPYCGSSATGMYAARVYDALLNCPTGTGFVDITQADGVKICKARETAALKWRRSEPSDAHFVAVDSKGFELSILIGYKNWIDANDSSGFNAVIVYDSHVTMRGVSVKSSISRTVSRLSDEDISVLRRRILGLPAVTDERSESVADPYDVDMQVFKQAIFKGGSFVGAKVGALIGVNEEIANVCREILQKIPQDEAATLIARLKALPTKFEESIGSDYELIRSDEV